MRDDEQLFIEWINRARADPAAEAARLGIDLNQDLLPGTLSATPKQPLAPHQALIGVAGAHSQDMIDRNFFDHVNPDGADPGQRIAAAGYAARTWGENIAYHTTPAAAHDLLFLSAGHRINILRDSFREIGVGVRVRPSWGVMVTEVFASRGGEALLTGVAFSDHLVPDNFYTPGEGLGGVTITAASPDPRIFFITTTGPTGGYALQVPPGTYQLTATGGDLSGSIAVAGVVVGTQNVKVDFVVPHEEPQPPAAPVARADRAMTEKDTAVVIDVLANDSGDVPLAPATVTIVTPPGNGQAAVDPVTGRVTYTPAAGWTGPDEFTYRVQDTHGIWTPPAGVVVAVIDPSGRPWQNPLDARDVNADGKVTPMDVLAIVNDLNVHQARALPVPSPERGFPPLYLDVNGDGRVDPQDVLVVVNLINDAAVGEGEARALGVGASTTVSADRNASGGTTDESRVAASPIGMPPLDPPPGTMTRHSPATERGRDARAVQPKAGRDPVWPRKARSSAPPACLHKSPIATDEDLLEWAATEGLYPNDWSEILDAIRNASEHETGFRRFGNR